MVRSALVRALPAFGLLVAGIAISLVGGGSTLGFVLGLAMVGVGAVGVISLVFYEVGRSEDRDREREGSNSLET